MSLGEFAGDLRKKSFGCANLKTLKMPEDSSPRILRESPLASMPVPDAHMKFQAYDQIRRRPREVIGDNIVREQVYFPRSDRGSPSCPKHQETRKLEHDKPPLEIPRATRTLNTKQSKTRILFTEKHRGDKNKLARLSSNWKFGRYRLLQNARLSREEERQKVLVGTRNDTECLAVVTQLRGACGNQDLHDRDGGGKELWKGLHASL